MPVLWREAKKNMATTEAGELKYYISCQKCYARSQSFTKNEEAAVKVWNRRNGSQTYRQYFEENFPKDKFPNADYEGMCRETFFGNDNENYNCAYGETSCEKCWNEEMK